MSISRLELAKSTAAAALLLTVGSNAGAEVLPDPHQAARPSETAVVADLAALLAGPQRLENRLEPLDSLLRRLGEPTPLRGFVQFLRGGALLVQSKIEPAREAYEESVRLLPDYSGPLIALSQLEAYADRPSNASDYLLRASEIDPDLVRLIPDYDLNNILIRLENRGEGSRRLRLAERLFEIGWLGGSLPLRSTLARELIEARVAQDDLTGARSLLPRLVNPADARILLMQNRYRALWPDVERWSGPRQERLWQPFLGELRAKWRASRDPDHGLAYVQGLAAANHHRSIVAEMLPLFTDDLDRRRDYKLIWIVAPLADALARLGRWRDVETLFARAARTWPLGSDANALNIFANRGKYLLYRGDAAAALHDFDASIADAGNHAGQVSAGALASMHLYRVCALHQLGRASASILSMGGVLSRSAAPDTIANLYLCMDRAESARAALIEALRHEELRDDVIAYLQPQDGPPMQSELHRLLLARQQGLRDDRLLRAAMSRHGRILPWLLSDGAPAEDDAR